jgi:hypothetical protein
MNTRVTPAGKLPAAGKVVAAAEEAALAVRIAALKVMHYRPVTSTLPM